MPISIALAVLETVVSVETPLPAAIAGYMLREFARPKEGSPCPVTPREREILGWISKGLTNREIAFELDISEQTVKNHLKNLLGKLGLDNRVQLATYALEKGWRR
ncbi:response regulator transcription factor [Paenibacillus xanthanilyticus]|uniref:Response regulator transcription factor n=1 Tax=Paenibacillus xanthanilyticus TaxID=1783531 RepID=A0ABV8KDD9_9BACL